MWTKTCHKAIAKVAIMSPDNIGASAVFKLLQARPALLERRCLKRSPTTVAASVAVSRGSLNGSVGDSTSSMNMNNINANTIGTRPQSSSTAPPIGAVTVCRSR
jgi:hypothetical protein